MDVEAKICGLTRPDDAAIAVAHGAWRLGVVFAGGPRTVDVVQAKAIVAAASGVPVIGVFGEQSVGTILKAARDSGLAGVQLHGSYDTDQARQLGAFGLEVWRVVPISEATPLHAALTESSRAADALLVEPRSPDGRGGKGVRLPLDLARRAREAAAEVRFVLAGGLDPESVAEAIAVVRPDVVDVSSGVELSPGIKDSGRLIRFLENVRVARTAR